MSEYRIWSKGEDILGDANGLAVVEGLELCKLLAIALDEIGEFVEEAGSLEASDILAPSGLKRGTSSCDGAVDVLFRGWRGGERTGSQSELSVAC